MPEGYTVNSQSTLDNYIVFATELFNEKKYVTFSYKLGKPRTIKQNGALGGFVASLADRFNACGMEMEVTSPALNKPIIVPWTRDSVMDKIWLPVQGALYPNKTRSSSELSTHEVAPVANAIINHFAKKKIHFVFAKEEFERGNKT